MVLKQLSEAMGIPGAEHEVREVIKKELAGKIDELRSDTLGNLICRKGPAEGPRVMLAAHMDEVGMLVSGFDKSGALRFRKAGGIDDRVLLSKQVLVGKSRIPGVLGAKPIHLQEESERDKPISSDHLHIDIGCKSKEEAQQKVKPGDPVVFATMFAEFGQGLVKGKAFDDRMGCAVLVEVLKQDWSIPVYGVFTTQEEIGSRGAIISAYSIAPQMGIALEGTICADLPGVDEGDMATELGKGPVLGLMDRSSIPNRKMREHILQIASEGNVPFQFRRATTGGNDAGPIALTLEGVPTLSVSVPCRNIHSPVAIANLTDFENTIKLVSLFLRSVERGFRP